MITYNYLEIAFQVVYYIPHQHELAAHGFPIRILNVSSIRHLFRKESLRRLIKHYKSRNRALIECQPSVERQVSDQVITNPVLRASYPS